MLGRLRFAAQDLDGAADALRHAARLDIHDPRPFADIADLELARNRLDAACAAQQTAIARDPNQPSSYVVLAGILEKLGRTSEAAAALKQAERLARFGPSRRRVIRGAHWASADGEACRMVAHACDSCTDHLSALSAPKPARTPPAPAIDRTRPSVSFARECSASRSKCSTVTARNTPCSSAA